MLDDDFHSGAQQLVRDLNRVYGETPALWQQDSSPEGFAWIDANDASGNTLSFLRLAQPARQAAAADLAARRRGEQVPGPGLSEAGQRICRRARSPGANVVACIANFSAVPHRKYRSACRSPAAGAR